MTAESARGAAACVAAVEGGHTLLCRATSVPVGRRPVLRGVAVTGAACLGGTLTACGGGDGGAPAGGGAPVASASEIPVGGGKVIEERKVVVTQPREGEFRAFSAVCTHQGCTVDRVENKLIRCPCHGSTYSIADASVQAGPATEPLHSYEVKIRDGQIVLR